jgi:hypothetical protein
MRCTPIFAVHSGKPRNLGFRKPRPAGYPERANNSSRLGFSPGMRVYAPEGTSRMGSVVKKRRKRMAKKKHRKLLRKTRVQRRRLGK